MASKLLSAHPVHTDFDGDIRCSLIEASMGNLFSMTLILSFLYFFLQENISRLTTFQVLRVSFLDSENEYIDLTERIFLTNSSDPLQKPCGNTDDKHQSERRIVTSSS